ncbi:hypothetical protein, partial [Sphingosinicella sp.]|uniref:hypothetical protein n=1 Tax=Sphingosinicella sp. TaxID=1917971 RepID=UPI0040379C9B
PNDAQFHDEVLRRLDRLERMVERLEREIDRGSALRPGGPPGGGRQEVVAAVNILCGANCSQMAVHHCRTLQFGNGVALNIERRGMADWVTRVRCFN